MKVAIAQLNPIVGDISGNAARLERTVEGLAAEAPQLVVFPELYLVGYPPRDLLERPSFLDNVERGIARILAFSRQHPGIAILFGAPRRHNGSNGRGLRNAALLVRAGAIIGETWKRLLPVYDVFDEERYFDPATASAVIVLDGERLGVHICEDAWNESTLWASRRYYDADPVAELVAQGATLLINISASPFCMGKERVRYALMSQHAARHSLPFLYVNQVGANDELVFDGRSLCLDRRGNAFAVLDAFREQVLLVDTDTPGSAATYQPLDDVAAVHDALVLGLGDYMGKVGFSKAVVGLSGGIDSALTFYLAVQALGRENVLGVSMPSQYSSQGSLDDSRVLAANLGAAYQVVPIKPTFDAYLATLEPVFAGTTPDVAEENIQARIRGNILMAISNKFGHLVLSTGNKSELSVGYCTLYGDMSGGLAVISDVPKQLVYKLARYTNREREIIPLPSITKAPSAELRPNQTDQDTLPPYEVLDAILQLYIEEVRSPAEIIAAGFEAETVEWVVRTVNRNEHKRRQAAPGLRVTSKAFGVGRRMPIAARFEL
jgi:NAD+ synthase (glutamine-hydrolysing)